MRRLNTGSWALLLCCAIGWLPVPSVGASDAPTVQALLAEQDAELVRQVVDWNLRSFELPENMELDQALRDSVAQLVRDHAARLRTLVPAWISEERVAAKNPNLRGAGLAHVMYLRSINEMAIESIESAGAAHDEAWLKAALVPTACRSMYPTNFARRIAMVQAAPADVRPALLSAEEQLLSRWGTPRQGLAPRPSAEEMAAADAAVARVREGLPVTAVPMTPFLAGQLFARDRNPGKADRWEQCAKSQWWLQSQLADGKTERTQALTIYRYSTMLDVDDFVPAGYKSKPPTGGKPVYPRAASYFYAEGTTTLQVSTDDQGKAVSAMVVARDVRVPGVRDNRAVAFEGLFDEASLDYARRRTYPAGKPGKTQFVMTWKLSEDADEPR